MADLYDATVVLDQSERRLFQTALADRNAEIDRLRAKLVAADRDRATWETQRKALEASKPPDVQTILSQKRELTMQLDREQNEKHELFLQINTYIAQLADSKREAAEAAQNERLLKVELDRLKSVQANQAQLEADVTELQAEVRRKTDEVERTRARLAETSSNFDLEREKLTNEINELDKELQLKTAALQSLRLVKGDPSAKSDADQLLTLEAALEKAAARNNDLETQLSTLQTQLNDKETLCSTLSAQQSASLVELASKEHTLTDLRNDSDELRANCDTLRQKVAALEEERVKLMQNSTTMSSLQTALKTEEDKNSALEEKNSRLEDELNNVKLRVALLESGASEEKKQTDSSLENALKEANARNAMLESSVVGLEKDLADARATIATVQQSLSASSALEANFADTKKSNEALKAQVARLEAELAEMKTNKDEEQHGKAMEAALSSAKAESAANKEALVKTAVQLAAAQASVEQLKNEVKELKSRPSLETVESLSAEISSVKAENVELKTRMADMQKASERTDLVEKLKAITAEKDRLSENLERISSRHEQSESKWNHELYDLQQKFRDADEAKHKLEDEVDELKRQLKSASERTQTPESSPPQAPPRKVNDESVKSALEENQKLKAELDKQQRLVSVLRRKLQHAQTTTG